MASRTLAGGVDAQVCRLQSSIGKPLLPGPCPCALPGPADELPPSPHPCPPSRAFCLGFPIYTTVTLKACSQYAVSGAQGPGSKSQVISSGLGQVAWPPCGLLFPSVKWA